MASTPSVPEQTSKTFLQILNAKSGGVIVALDALRRQDALTGVSLSLPRIVTIGPESCGKSSVLERLIGHPLFPRDEGICTRMPMELRCKHYTAEDWEEFCRTNSLSFLPKGFYSRLFHEQDGKDGKEYDPTRYMEVHELYNIIKKHHDDIVIRKNGSLTGIVADAVLVIEILGIRVQNLRLIDLPGIVQAHRPGEASDIAEQTINLVKKYLQDENTMVLAIVAATEGFRTSTAMRLVQEFKKEKQTIGVLTKADLTQDGRTEAKEDPFRLLKEKLDLVSKDMIDLPSGLVALRNHDTAYDKKVGLRSIKKREADWFDQHLPGYAEKGQVGLTALAEKLVQMMLKFTEEKWVPSAIDTIETAKAQKIDGMVGEFGPLPTPEEAHSFLLQLCGLVCKDWETRGFFNPDGWTSLFYLPRLWEKFIEPTQWNLASLISWRQFKARLLDESFITKVLSDLLNLVFILGTLMFSEAHSPSLSPEIKLHRFGTLDTTISSLFFHFEITPEVVAMVHHQFALLCSIYESLPSSRSELPARLSSGLRSIVFEHILLENFECTSAMGITPESLCQALLSHLPLQDLLQEKEEWAANRSQHMAIIRGLTKAHKAIDLMVASLGK